MAVHGDIDEITYNHPTIGSGVFHAKAGEGNTYDPGGYRSNDDAAMITTDGQIMDQKNRVRGYFEVVIENDVNIRQDAETVRSLARDSVHATWTLTTASGAVLSGTGLPVGDIQPDLNAGTMTLKVAVPDLSQV